MSEAMSTGETTTAGRLRCNFNKALKKLTSLVNIRSSVHPIEPSAHQHSEFVPVGSYTIRTIHVKPDCSQYNDKRISANRSSLTEEYWFTRWNKPLRSGLCSCSFRRSGRFSKLSEQLLTASVKRIAESTSEIGDVDTFAERLLKDAFSEAYREYCISKKCGVDNLAYVDEVDTVVLRRNKEPAVLNAECVTANVANNNVKLQRCRHNAPSNKEKPLVILLHGIGSSADVWWNVINNLVRRGYEVVAPDLLGHGYSSAPDKRKAYKFKKLLDYTFAVFDHYAQKDEERKLIIIGHSFGCSLATALARNRAQVVQLVLISGGGPTGLSTPVVGTEVSAFGCLQLLISPLLFCGLKRSLFYSSRGKHFKPCTTDSSIPEYVLKYISSEQNWPEGDAAFHRRILIPTLLVHGLKDTQVTLVQECEMERTIPRAFLELIPTAGHMSMLETPEQLSHMILCFIDWWST